MHTRQRIAIIGGGAAGATAAWLLARVHEVTLFEAEKGLGGHAYTQAIGADGRNLPVDVGVDLFHEELYPNLTLMLRQFKLESYEVPLSFRAIFDQKGSGWSNLTQEGALLAELQDEFRRFHQDMVDVQESADAHYQGLSIGAFLDERGYSHTLKNMALLPIMATFSGCEAPSLEYSLRYVARAFALRMLGFFAPGAWRKPSGGFITYLKVIEEELGTQVRLETRVRKVRRRGDGKLEVDVPGATETFDKVVLATSADLALRLLENPTSQHQEALGGFSYVDVVAVLHDDGTILENPDGGEYCEYLRQAGNGDDQPDTAQLTRINNNLPGHGGVHRPLLVTIDPKRPIAEGAVLAEKHWRLPKLRPTDFSNKKKLHTIQGLWDLWYCGLDTSLTGHEGAIVSGMVIAEQLGGRYPFPEGSAAHSQFLAIRQLMGFSAEPGSEDLASTIVVPGI